MTAYRKRFALDRRDIDVIERAIRAEISRCAVLEAGQAPDSDHARARELNEVLAKIFHQKRFYSQVKLTGVPSG